MVGGKIKISFKINFTQKILKKGKGKKGVILSFVLSYYFCVKALVYN